MPTRHLVIVLGDQLDPCGSMLDGFDARQDVVWMAEVAGESKHVWSHKARSGLFLAAMRHHAEALRGRGFRVDYRMIDDVENSQSLGEELRRAVGRLRPAAVVMTEAGDWRVAQAIRDAVTVRLEEREDRHFYNTREEFAAFARGRKQLRLEHFYRQMRRKHGVLMDGDKPVGGDWNYDEENRGHFAKTGPGDIAEPMAFAPDALTRSALAAVQTVLGDHPGSLDSFDWPVTVEQARAALEDFIRNRLANFGAYQDAMWMESPWLYHSRLSAALNLKLLSPREVVGAAEEAYRRGAVPLASAEGFVRQILGWREYVRGVYWHFMPEYAELNALGASHPLPGFYWDADTDMNCLRECLGQTLRYGYAHHIQRLMVIGLYALLLGVRPFAVHEWFLAVYVDAVEWVEMPNVLGMSQFGDGGLMSSKPYVATGKYIARMSNYCGDCRYRPDEATGERACPFTTLYWDFLLRHRAFLAKNQRMGMQLKNLERLGNEERRGIQEEARRHRLKVLGEE